ncbi:hypothetical protein PsYK624_159960 [Phanerochaete sordida]|uniref:F-box domain-containing protein n=1 Tax=Phanerochaete sordida TaxID=48140 RepID=A0A9P3GQ76_9APHY|nr:hypothetical protein PsYK624_159960 [Phanerochaete sordida]
MTGNSALDLGNVGTQAVTIGSLHDEILEDIFDLVAYRNLDWEWIGNRGDLGYYESSSLGTLQLVCSRWQRVVQYYQQFWATLVLPLVSAAYIHRAVRLSGTAPLCIITDEYIVNGFMEKDKHVQSCRAKEVATLLLDLLSTEASRISTLIVDNMVQDLCEEICLENPDRVVPGTPHLRVLHLWWPPESSMFWDTFVAKAPHLDVLSFPPFGPFDGWRSWSTILTTPPFTQLRFLALGTPCYNVLHSYPGPLLTLLRQLPNLETLVLCRLSFRETSPTGPSLPLPCLRTLHCDYLHCNEMPLLAMIDCPALSRFTMTNGTIPMDENGGPAALVAALRHIITQLQPDMIRHVNISVAAKGRLVISGWSEEPYTKATQRLLLEFSFWWKVEGVAFLRAVCAFVPLDSVRVLHIQGDLCLSPGAVPVTALAPLGCALTGVEHLRVSGILSAETLDAVARLLHDEDASDGAPSLPALQHAAFELEAVCPQSPRPQEYVDGLCSVLSRRAQTRPRPLDMLRLHFREGDGQPSPDARPILCACAREAVLDTGRPSLSKLPHECPKEWVW